jgi:hypothetical protein
MELSGVTVEALEGAADELGSVEGEAKADAKGEDEADTAGVYE